MSPLIFRRLTGAVVMPRGEPRAAGRLETLLEAALPPRAGMTRAYPTRADSWRILAHYPVRWKGLWVRYRGVFRRLVTRDRAFVEDARKEAQLRESLGWK